MSMTMIEDDGNTIHNGERKWERKVKGMKEKVRGKKDKIMKKDKRMVRESQFYFLFLMLQCGSSLSNVEQQFTRMSVRTM